MVFGKFKYTQILCFDDINFVFTLFPINGKHFENVDVTKSNFKRIVSEFLNFIIIIINNIHGLEDLNIICHQLSTLIY